MKKQTQAKPLETLYFLALIPIISITFAFYCLFGGDDDPKAFKPS